MIGLAFTPSWRSIGIAAPILAVLFRLLQGFALGGETGPSAAMLMEAAPPARRGLYVSLQFANQNGAVLVAGVIGLVLANMLSPDMLVDWGWRVAFSDRCGGGAFWIGPAAAAARNVGRHAR